MTRSLLGLLAVPLLAYGAVLVALWWGQERLIFRPTPLPPDAPLAQAPDIHERWVEVEDARLSVLALRVPAPKDHATPCSGWCCSGARWARGWPHRWRPRSSRT